MISHKHTSTIRVRGARATEQQRFHGIFRVTILLGKVQRSRLSGKGQGVTTVGRLAGQKGGMLHSRHKREPDRLEHGPLVAGHLPSIRNSPPLIPHLRPSLS